MSNCVALLGPPLENVCKRILGFSVLDSVARTISTAGKMARRCAAYEDVILRMLHSMSRMRARGAMCA